MAPQCPHILLWYQLFPELWHEDPDITSLSQAGDKGRVTVEHMAAVSGCSRSLCLGAISIYFFNGCKTL